KLFKIFGQTKCLYGGILLCMISAIGIMLITFLEIHDPLIITGTIMILSVGVVFPVNILYPMSLEVVKNSKSRAAAILNASRLIMTAITLEVVSLFYNGHFFPIGIAMFAAIGSSFWFIRKLFNKTWIHFSSSTAEFTPTH